MTQNPSTTAETAATDDYGVVAGHGTVRLERTLPGPIERVWKYLTESEKRSQWLASGEMDLRIGGRVELIFRNNDLTSNDDQPPEKYAQYGDEKRMHGRITACEPPRLLSYTWNEESGIDSEVTFELTPDNDNVRLVVTHRRLATREDLVGVSGGWHAHLAILEARLRQREPAGFWATFKRLEAEYEERIQIDDESHTP